MQAASSICRSLNPNELIGRLALIRRALPGRLVRDSKLVTFWVSG